MPEPRSQQIKDVMTPEVATLSPTAKAIQAAEAMGSNSARRSDEGLRCLVPGRILTHLTTSFTA